MVSSTSFPLTHGTRSTAQDVEDCPVAIATLSSLRTTFVSYVQGGSMSITATWALAVRGELREWLHRVKIAWW
jgi:hypothetical protein